MVVQNKIRMVYTVENEVFMEFFEKLGAGKIGFSEVGAEAGKIYDQVAAEGGTVANLWNQGVGYIEGLVSSYLWVIPAVLAVLSLIQLMFGKKLLGFQKFVACLVVGFACGVTFVYPLLAQINITFIPDWVVGLVVGLVAALLSKPIYFLAYVIAAGGATYILCTGGILPEAVSSFTKDWYIGVAAAVVAIVVALLLRKFIEMLGTSALGGFTLALSINSILIITGVAPAGQQLAGWAFWAIAGAAALIGFIIQVATRRKA